MVCISEHRRNLIERRKRERIIKKIREKRWSKRKIKPTEDKAQRELSVLDMYIYLN